MSAYEIVGVVFGLLSVLLTVRQNIWCWPTGIVSVAAFAVLFLQSKLYADAGLQIFFLATSCHGWYWWLHGGLNQTELSISRLTLAQKVWFGLALVVCIVMTGSWLSLYTDASIPFWDASASGGSVLAQLLLMRKKLETWYLWIAVDVLSIGIYLYKEIYLTAFLYVIFLFLAAGGLMAWRRSLAAL